jgi:hypothetical protein
MLASRHALLLAMLAKVANRVALSLARVAARYLSSARLVATAAP